MHNINYLFNYPFLCKIIIFFLANNAISRTIFAISKRENAKFLFVYNYTFIKENFSPRFLRRKKDNEKSIIIIISNRNGYVFNEYGICYYI